MPNISPCQVSPNPPSNAYLKIFVKGVLLPSMSLDIHKSPRVRIEPLNGFALVHGESRQLDEPTHLSHLWRIGETGVYTYGIYTLPVSPFPH